MWLASQKMPRLIAGCFTSFAEAIWDIYQNPEKYAQVAGRGQLWVKDNLGWDKYCGKMVELLFKAVD